MARLLIVYSGQEKKVEKIAHFIAEELVEASHKVEVFEITDAPSGVNLNRYDGVILGAPIHTGKYQRSICRWTGVNSELISRKPGAFFSLGLGLREELSYAAGFLKESGWQPGLRTVFTDFTNWENVKKLSHAFAKKVEKESSVSHVPQTHREFLDIGQHLM